MPTDDPGDAAASHVAIETAVPPGGAIEPTVQDGTIEAAVRAGDRTGWLAALFAPEPARPALHALAAYRLELRRVVQGARDPFAAEMRLQWWRDAIQNIGTGAGRSVPLVDALRHGMVRFAWPAATLTAVSEAHIHDLYADPFETFDAFDGYAGETFGALTQLGAMALGIVALDRTDGFAAARTAATAAGWAGVALAAADAALGFAAGAARGRSTVPLAAFPIPSGVSAALAAARVPDGSEEAVRAMAAHGERAATELDRLLPFVHAAVRPAFLPAAVVRPRLVAAARRPLDPAAPPAWRLQLALWRSARRMSKA